MRRKRLQQVIRCILTQFVLGKVIVAIMYICLLYIHAVFAEVTISGPVSQSNVPPRTNVTLSVGVTGHTGDTVPVYYWQLNGMIISDGENYTGINTDTLIVISLGEGNVGLYSCIVIVDQAVFFSSSAQLSLCKYTQKLYK